MKIKKIILSLFACSLICGVENIFSSGEGKSKKELKTVGDFKNFIAGLSEKEKEYFDITVEMSNIFYSGNAELLKQKLEKIGKRIQSLAQAIPYERLTEITWQAERYGGIFDPKNKR